MSLHHLKKILILCCLCYLPFSGRAWGLLGHRIIGQIADSYLTKKAKKTIAHILGNESVAMASNWPDFIKSDPAYNSLNSWHYINLNAGLTENSFTQFLNADTSVDAFTKINFLVNELKNKNLAAENKVMYLRLLIHIVGDVHQPLHVGRPEDSGGNKIKLHWFGTPTNLHAVWDNQLINFQQLSYTEYATAINFITPEERTILQHQSVATWLFESYKIVQKIYADSNLTDAKLDYEYNFKYLDILNSQLLKGGVRLAGLLNEIFG